MLRHETGVLSATTAFGKTVVAAWLIAQRNISTLVLVHRRQLLDQWVERLAAFLPQMTAVRLLLERIGRAALPIFLAHRVVVQAGSRILAGHLPSAVLTALLIATALFTCFVITYAREHRQQIRAVLTDLGI